MTCIDNIFRQLWTKVILTSNIIVLYKVQATGCSIICRHLPIIFFYTLLHSWFLRVALICIVEVLNLYTPVTVSASAESLAVELCQVNHENPFYPLTVTYFTQHSYRHDDSSRNSTTVRGLGVLHRTAARNLGLDRYAVSESIDMATSSGTCRLGGRCHWPSRRSNLLCVFWISSHPMCGTVSCGCVGFALMFFTSWAPPCCK